MMNNERLRQLNEEGKIDELPAELKLRLGFLLLEDEKEDDQEKEKEGESAKEETDKDKTALELLEDGYKEKE